ncbi:MAG: GNAT family N-acetyltransferase [Bacilli bacterium]
MLHLEKFDKVDASKSYAFLQELPSEAGFVNKYIGMSKKEFEQNALKERTESERGINLKEGYVPDTYYFLVDGQEIVGLFKLRHYLNDFLREGPGHIGYAIHPNYRRRGYASKGLSMAVIELKKIMDPNESEIYLSCNLSNTGSLKVQLNNGAYIHHKDDSHYYTRIRVR